MLALLGPLVVAHVVTATPAVPVTLYDENHDETVVVTLGLDGTSSPADAATLQRVLRCKRTERQHPISSGTLAVLAQLVARHPGHVVELVSGYRAAAKESKTSKHRAGAAIDFRLRGADTAGLRDELWRTPRDLGLGWYPSAPGAPAFLHLDHRPGEGEMSWTFSGGTNRYHPQWSRRAREASRARGVRRGAGA